MTTRRWQNTRDGVHFTIEVDVSGGRVTAQFNDTLANDDEVMSCSIEAFLGGELHQDARDFLDQSGLDEVIEACRRSGVSSGSGAGRASSTVNVTSSQSASASSSSGGGQVILNHHGARKIMVIKAIRELTVMGLKEAKDLSETPGAVVLEGVSQDEGARAVAYLEDAGASAEWRGPATPASSASATGAGASERIVLLNHGPQKIAAIKALRQVTGLGLKEAKALSETPGATIIEGLSEARAREVVSLLEGVGVELDWGSRATVVPRDQGVNVMLLSCGPNKIQVIKTLRTLTGLGLMDAKILSESGPIAVLEGVPRDRAEEAALALQESGARVELVEAAGENGEFKLKLCSFDSRKIQAIKLVREVFSLGLREAKDLVDQTPVILAHGLSKAEVQGLVERFNAAGFVVEVVNE